MSTSLNLTRIFWRWYAALLLANAVDLLFTYAAVERGIAEWNPILRPFVLTPWPPLVKLAAFALLGYGLWQVVRHGRRPGTILVLLQSATLVYLVVIGLHLAGFVLSAL
jgi:hypothetical protein